jgi:hypothetical protein
VVRPRSRRISMAEARLSPRLGAAGRGAVAMVAPEPVVNVESLQDMSARSSGRAAVAMLDR